MTTPLSEIEKVNAYLMRYLKNIRAVREGTTVNLTLTFQFDTVEQAKDYINRVKEVQIALKSQTQ